ncbi:MAG: hypothetical protein NZ890_02345 [Myxococcota bacterium]|nr:hypothetical protein [Myxococcota bacterium]
MPSRIRSPRRRTVVPLGGRPAAGLRLGVPLQAALRTPLSDLQRSTEAMAAVAAQMTLPATDERAVGGLAQVLGQRQELIYLTAQALRRAPEIVARSGVSPEVLHEGRRKLDVLFRARRLATQAQNLAADGRLLLGARFSYLLGLLVAAYERRLADANQPLAARLQLAADFARLDALRFRLLARAAERRAATAALKDQLRVELSEHQDSEAFYTAQRLLEQGRQPDLETLERALRHARRLEAEAEQERRNLPRT